MIFSKQQSFFFSSIAKNKVQLITIERQDVQLIRLLCYAIIRVANSVCLSVVAWLGFFHPVQSHSRISHKSLESNFHQAGLHTFF